MKKNEQKLATCLWFDNNAEEAMLFYESIFKDDFKRGSVLLHGEAGPGPKGTVLTASFYIHGHEFVALNGGPYFKFTEAISLVLRRDTQEEIDELWTKLTAGGGQESMCGWLKDKFGLSWQVVPPVLIEMLQDKNPKKATNVMQVMMKMRKLEIKPLQEAYDAA